MSYIVEQKIKGNIYLYEVTSYWDKKKKQSRQKRKYLGRKKHNKKKKVLNNAEIIHKKYGNVFLLQEIVKKLGLDSILESVFPEHFQDILSLSFFSVCNNSALYTYSSWLEEHQLPKSKKLYSSDISTLCELIGYKEKSVYDFFDEWTAKCNIQKGVYFDITSISSYANDIDFIEWGYNRDHERLPQLNIGLFCSEETELPIYYHIYPGSISDVSTLKNGLAYLKSFDLNDIMLVLDRGFCSKKNILAMNECNSMSFIQPMTFSMKKVSNMIRANRKKLHNISTAIKFKEEILHYATTDFNLENAIFTAHIFYNEKAEVDQRHNLLSHLFDIENNFKIKIFESQKEYLDYRNEEIPEKYRDFFKYNRSLKTIERNDRKLKSHLLKAGYFVFLSNNHELDEYSILQHYRKRDIVEKMFDIGKTHMDSKRLRCHSDYNTHGRIFIKFIALITYSYIMHNMKEKKLFKKYTVKELLATLSKIRYTVIKGERIIGEVSRAQREILKAFDITPEMVT
jgi:transposase